MTYIKPAPTCEWFSACTNPTEGFVSHPTLGAVPCCERCATKLDMKMMSFVIECPEEGCGELHPAEYDHAGQYGEGPIFAVVCTSDQLTSYFTTELLIAALPEPYTIKENER